MNAIKALSVEGSAGTVGDRANTGPTEAVWSSPCAIASMCLGDLGLTLEDVGDDATSTHSAVTHVSKQCAIAARGLMRHAWRVPISCKETAHTTHAGRQHTAGHAPRKHAHARIHAHQHTHEPAPPPPPTHGGHALFISFFSILPPHLPGNVGRKEEVWDDRRTVGSGNNGWPLT